MDVGPARPAGPATVGRADDELLGTQIVRLVRNVVAYLHLERWREETTIADCRCCVPDLDNVEVSLGTECHAGNALIVALEKGVCHAVHHAIYKDRMRIARIDLLGPCTSPRVLWTIPERWNSVSHEEEHACFPYILGDSVNDIPELWNCCDLVDCRVTLERIVAVVRIVIPKGPHFVLGPLYL